MDKLTQADATSQDIVMDNIDKLKAIFPEAVTEGKIDFDALKETLGEYLETREERYNFSWAGKSKARRLAQTPTTGTLRPCPEESVDWDKTENLFIEGDNLEVLKLLQKSYQGQVKMIYIDPPYNTGGDFVYPDKYADNLKGYLEYTDQVDAEGNRHSSNTESSGRYHSNWLNMILPRLHLAKNLLTRDGALFVSIGDDEVNNLKKLLDEIFGDENHVATVPRVAKRTSDKGTHFRPTKDYILVYSKILDELPEFGVPKDVDESKYKLVEADGRKYKQSGASLYQPSLDSRPNQRYYIEAPDGSLIIPPGSVFPSEKIDGAKVLPKSNSDKVWRWSVDSYLKQKHLLIFTKGSDQNPLVDENGNQSKWNIYPKVYLDEDLNSTLHPEDIIYDCPNSQGTKELNKLSIPFSFSKPTRLITFLIKLMKDKDCTVLDFFAGSCSTAHSVLDQNLSDKGNRKFIMVQLPEITDSSSEAFNAGFKTIAEIGKARIRRVALKIKEDHPDYKGDLGFKVFKLDSSNIEAWDSNIENLEDNVLKAANVLKDDRNELDIVYELFLKYGLDLSYPVNTHEVAGKQVYEIGAGSLFICLEDGITNDFVEALIQLYETFDSEAAPRVVFKDSGFKTDATKKDAESTLKDAGILDVKCL